MRGRKFSEFWQLGIALIAFSVLLMATIGYNSEFDLKARDGFYRAVRYLELPAVVLKDAAGGVLLLSEEKRSLLETIDSLQRENIALRVQLNNLQSLKELNDPGTPTAFKAGVNTLKARIIYRHPGWWWRYISVDRGGADGVKRGMPVLSGKYVVGRVFLAEDRTSIVELITSPDLRMPVVVEETRDIGVLSGNGKGKMVLSYMPKDVPLQQGMKVVSAFAMDNFLPGLLVGTVEGIQEESNEDDFRSYDIKPSADLSQLRSVTILEVM